MTDNIDAQTSSRSTLGGGARSWAFNMGVVIVLCLVLAFVWLVVPAIHQRYPEDPLFKMAPNEWGDLLAGLFGPLAFIVLALGYASQREELILQRQELAAQRSELVLQREETARVADEAALQRQILQQQAERAELNGRISEWAFVQEEMRQLAAMVIYRYCGEFTEFDPLLFMRLRMPNSLRNPDRAFDIWGGASWRIHDSEQVEMLAKIARVYRQFAGRVPHCGPLNRSFFDASTAAEIAAEIDTLLLDYQSDHALWFDSMEEKSRKRARGE